MKRTQIPKCNRNNKSIFNHINRNIVCPTLFLNPVVLNEEISSGVEIIEINDEETKKEQPDKLPENSWFTKYENLRNDHDGNRSIGQIRYIKHEQKYDTCNDLFDQACTEFYGGDCRGNRNYSKQLPTIVSNEVSSATSSSDIEVIQSESSITDSYDSHKMYEAYAPKAFDENRQLFHNLLNIPSHESTSFSSYTDDEHDTDFINIGRIATRNPIYIARLNLPSSPTLPTVTEVTEPNKSLEITGSNSQLYHKSNSWCNSENTVKQNQNKQKLSALSERERRRKRLKEIQERRTERLESRENLQINFNKEDVMEISINSSINSKDKIMEPFVLNKLEEEREISLKSTEKNSDTTEEKEDFKAIEVYDCDLDYSRDQEGRNSSLKLSSRVAIKPNSLQDKSSVPSLHLSFNTEVEEERKSCLKRLLQCVRCCK